MKNAIIYCETPADAGSLKFYLRSGNDIFYLFNQRYKSSVESYFMNGVPLNKLSSQKKSKDHSVSKVATKLPLYIRYIEKEYDTAILNKTIKKAAIYS